MSLIFLWFLNRKRLGAGLIKQGKRGKKRENKVMRGMTVRQEVKIS